MVEGDLSLYHHLRYTDRWRFDADGSRKLTLREIWVRIQQLPGDSRLVRHANDGRPRWNDETYLLSDLAHILSGKPHPARPKSKDGDGTGLSRERQIRRAKARRLYRERRRARVAGRQEGE